MYTYSIPRLITKLGEQGVRFIIRSGETLYVEREYVTYTLQCGVVDIEVYKVNVGRLASIPTTYTDETWFDRRLTEETLAYRILCAMAGEPIDYTLYLEATEDNLACKRCGIRLLEALAEDAKSSGYGAINYHDDLPYCDECLSQVIYDEEIAYQETLAPSEYDNPF